MKHQVARLRVELLEGRITPSIVWVRTTDPATGIVRLVRTEVADPGPVIAPAPAPIVKAAPVWSGSVTPTIPTGPIALAPVAPRTSTPPVTQTNPLAGTGSGLYVCNLQYMTTPTGFHFTGTANLNGLGRVDVQLDAYGVGFKTNSQATGSLLLSNAQGSVTVALTGPTQPALSPLPQQFQYRVISATGAYSKITASGSLRLLRTADAIPVRGGIRYIETGTFQLII